MEYTIPTSLIRTTSFSRSEFEREMEKEYGMNKQKSKYVLQKKLDQGAVVRAGWNQYVIGGGKKRYTYIYSDETNEIVQLIERNFYNLDFQIFELIQLNSFVNHLIAHNTIFVSAENDLVDFVFDTLNRTYPGRVLFKPSLDLYHRYQQNNGIVVTRLPSESPNGFEQPWHVRLERIIVDVIVDKLIGGIVPEGEKPDIIQRAYHDYLIDEATMIRYAKRKGAETKLRKGLQKYGRTARL